MDVDNDVGCGRGHGRGWMTGRYVCVCVLLVCMRVCMCCVCCVCAMCACDACDASAARTTNAFELGVRRTTCGLQPLVKCDSSVHLLIMPGLPDGQNLAVAPTDQTGGRAGRQADRHG